MRWEISKSWSLEGAWPPALVLLIPSAAPLG